VSFQTLNLVCDSSTLANFKAWAQPISSWLSTAGWLQSSDTGQVNWSTIASVPGVNSYVYEVWEPNDGLTNFYLKVEYGNNNISNSPAVRLTIGTATNGAGTLTGTVMGPYATQNGSGITPPSTTIQYPCNFSGAAGRLAVMMWRTAPNQAAQAFAVERSVNAAGAYTGTHVTLMTAGAENANVSNMGYQQQTLVFGVGVAPAQSTFNTIVAGGMAVRAFYPNNTGASGNFNGAVPFDTTAPAVGFYDYPLTSFGWGGTPNYTEGQVFTTTLYGSTRTYIATQTQPLTRCGPNAAWGTLCMRYD
jgi:hypothetical protein